VFYTLTKDGATLPDRIAPDSIQLAAGILEKNGFWHCYNNPYSQQ